MVIVTTVGRHTFAVKNFRGFVIQCITRIFRDFYFRGLGYTAKISLLSKSPTCALLQDGRAGRVPRVKNLTCKLNFANFNFAVRPQPRRFVVRENYPPYG